MAQSCLLEKGTKLHVIIGNPPSNYHEDLFSQFKAECKNQMLLVSGYWIPITYTSGCWDRHVKKVDTETKFSVILIFAINAFIWCNFEKKCLELVIACRPLKLTTSAARATPLFLKRRCSEYEFFVHFLEELRTPCIVFEIFWPSNTYLIIIFFY